MILRHRIALIGLFLACVFPMALLTSCGGRGIIPGRGREKAPVINEEQARAHLGTAQDFMKGEKWAHANYEFKSAIEADYRLFPAHLGYQDTFFSFFNPDVPRQLDQQNEMLAMYKKYAKNYPSEAMFQYLYGRMLDKMNRRREASAYFKEAIRLNDQYYSAHADLAKFYGEVDKSPALAKFHREKSEKYRAIYELRTQLAAAPNDIALHRQYQDVMLAAEKSNDVPSGTVLGEYEKRLRDVAGDGKREAQYLYLYGRLLGQTGELEEAREHFERASALNKKLPWPYDGLGTYYIRKSQEAGTSAADSHDYIKKALQMFEKAARKDSDEVIIQLKLAGLCMEISALRLQQAEDIRSKAEYGIMSAENERRVKELLREAYRLSKDSKAALLEMINRGVKNPAVYQQLAMLMFKDGCYFMARQTALVGLALLDDNPPPDPATRGNIRVKLTGISKDCDVYVARLEKDRDVSGMAFPQLFFKGEFRARLQSANPDFRARTVKNLAAFYIQIIQDREKIDPVILPDYEKMQADALVQIGLALEDDSEDVRLAAVGVLGLLRVQPFCAAIGKILENPDEDEELRKEAAIALGKMKTVEAVGCLIQGIKDKDEYVREESANALDGLGVQTFGYNFDDDRAQRAEKIKKIEEWWQANKDTHKIPRDG